MPPPIGPSPTPLKRQVNLPEISDSCYDGPETCVSTLPEGYKKSHDRAPFRIATTFEKDAKVCLRDGSQVRADIFRPACSVEPVPALIAWSPYGKSGRGHFRLDIVPGRVGVPQNRLSGFEKFEAPDPAEWTARGYAIVNVDPRGVYDSDGDINWFGTVDGRDGYDVVERIAELPWCNGSIALVGNSWLAMAQWFIAAECPPHLKCIAPLEGASDVYRELLCRGGVPQTAFWEFLADGFIGRNQQEDVIAMLNHYPQMNEYWEDKRAQVGRIKVPVYVLASYSTFLHTMGSFRGFEEIQHDKKWLRVHSTQEWHDLYQPSTNDELQLFFDRYTKGIENGWEETPRVRISLLQFNKDPIINVPFEDWPVPSTEYKKLFLNENGSLSPVVPHQEASSSISYRSDVTSLQVGSDIEELCFQYTFTKKTYVVGCARAVLYMSCPDHDDMDVFVQLRKADKAGRLLENINIPLEDLQVTAAHVEKVNPLIYLGPSGVLRASYCDIDSKLSKPHWPEHYYGHRTPVPRGKIVKMDIGIWQTGIAFDAGEKIFLKVSGHNMTLAEFPQLRGALPTYNVGRHHIHLGGANQSHLLLPLVDVPNEVNISCV
ncbi:CocE/NonD family hydrolase [Aspergillus ibericus CBS 121593]|uniref:Alpha/beta-hydrolase n=1 Tax=Aspergillus ibericus CBS 121593 TaxID=1448316 RepID=A0A395GKE5_9EURO|nr:alpha/beta-hydrolase [Aspergillus ibericus CBS 121593]RAK95961.1 alpha/beta-hydrolase [Aspergillus ibericus CBS 121593]